MDNDTQFDPAAIRMAYFALLLSGRKYDNLELAVAQEMLKMNRLVSERSLPSLIGRSIRITATINSVEYEESSKRYLIKFQADNGEKEERVRSERMDSNHKDAVKKFGNENWSATVPLFSNARIGLDPKRLPTAIESLHIALISARWSRYK